MVNGIYLSDLKTIKLLNHGFRKKNMEQKKSVGRVSHYYTKIGVAVIDLSDSLAVGDKISIQGASTNFTQTVDSMQIEHKDVKQANSGDSIGLKVAERVREGDNVYKLIPT